MNSTKELGYDDCYNKNDLFHSQNLEKDSPDYLNQLRLNIIERKIDSKDKPFSS